MPLKISNAVEIPDSEIEWQAVRAQGAGGQNVNKVSSAVHLRYDIKNSTLPPFYKERLLNQRDSRLTKDGVFILKSQESRHQDRNKELALARLLEWIKKSTVIQKQRKPTKSTYGSKQKRMDKKTQRGQVKKNRGKVDY